MRWNAFSHPKRYLCNHLPFQNHLAQKHQEVTTAEEGVMTEVTGTGHEADSTAACPSVASSFVLHRNTEGETHDLLHTGQHQPVNLWAGSGLTRSDLKTA